ncbi:MAG: hypothetical protein AAGF12_09110 [Myxococcota bacterium]
MLSLVVYGLRLVGAPDAGDLEFHCVARQVEQLNHPEYQLMQEAFSKKGVGISSATTDPYIEDMDE